MFGKSVVRDMINRSAENETDRRVFLKAAGVAGLGTLGAGSLGALGASPAEAATPTESAVLNFALNLEYLEAEFYHRAAYGRGLDSSLIGGTGTLGSVSGGRKVHFATKRLRSVAQEIAGDETHHVAFLRQNLGSAAVSRPKIDLYHSFTAAARAAGLIKKHQRFDPFANENNFLLAAFIFEDVGVTAYKGAAPLIGNSAYLEAAAGILAVEAYHAGIIREKLYDRGLGYAADKISRARDSLDGTTDLDQGPAKRGYRANLVPTDANGVAFSRSPQQVLNVVYLNPAATTSGGFYPSGVNGVVNTSGANG
ncbi:ferritin-like domain-containing protein [Nocardioides mangrovicus]|uniref:Ferritin-like domain-containing protein n=1 Tax=Nocardioides mangrovicus TaxID=2478913 RepID=A0A3L8P2D7_9ACTN|nr:ferritin-like domain-containing protein [Nocardioides mangrovicus]RLV49566.1 ferritin-like domain-containing protein [Nocardioides mangrovicus]